MSRWCTSSAEGIELDRITLCLHLRPHTAWSHALHMHRFTPRCLLTRHRPPPQGGCSPRSAPRRWLARRSNSTSRLLHDMCQLMPYQPPSFGCRRRVATVRKDNMLSLSEARAWTAIRADSAALVSVCTLTRLKSCPNRGSNELGGECKPGCPDDCSTSCTMAGACPEVGSDDPAGLVCSFFPSSSQASHLRLIWGGAAVTAVSGSGIRITGVGDAVRLLLQRVVGRADRELRLQSTRRGSMKCL